MVVEQILQGVSQCTYSFEDRKISFNSKWMTSEVATDIVR